MRRETRIIIHREYMERVRTRAFIIGTLIFPLFLAGILILPSMVEGRGGERTLVLVDDTEAAIGTAMSLVLTRATESDEDYRYTVEHVTGTIDEHRAGLTARMNTEEIDGYVVLPRDVVETNLIQYRARNIANRQVLRDVTRAASGAVTAERLRRTGIQLDDLTSLLTPVRVEEAEVRAGGEEGRGAASTFFFAYIVAFLIYFMVAFYGMSVLRSVLEEKTTRISEVMVSSVRASQLMLGKILGVSAAALLQVGIWIGLIVMATRVDYLAELFRIPEGLRYLTIEPMALGLFITFFMLGFLLYAALFAALGAAVTSEQEAQSFQLLLMLPLFVPMLFLGQITNEPLGPLATVLGIVPLSAPIAMSMRVATAPIPAAQIAGTIGLLVVTVALMAWLAGKIYRIGILSTGRRPSMRELARWLRQA